MFFNFNEYYIQLFKVPLFIISFSILFIVIILVGFYSNYSKENKRFAIKKMVPGGFIGLVVMVILLITGIIQLNYKTILDKNINPEFITGEIVLIENLNPPPRFYYDGHIVIPKLITINNQKYYIMTIGEFEIGDNVVIEYLPNSKVVLSIYYSDD